MTIHTIDAVRAKYIENLASCGGSSDAAVLATAMELCITPEAVQQALAEEEEAA